MCVCIHTSYSVLACVSPFQCNQFFKFIFFPQVTCSDTTVAEHTLFQAWQWLTSKKLLSHSHPSPSFIQQCLSFLRKTGGVQPSEGSEMHFTLRWLGVQNWSWPRMKEKHCQASSGRWDSRESTRREAPRALTSGGEFRMWQWHSEPRAQCLPRGP